MYIYKPVVKWAGGKSKLIKQLSSYLPKYFNNYHEPFLGGAALFFYLAPEINQRKATAYLSDLTEELINLYQVIQNNVEELIETAKTHKYEKEYYYKIRALDPSTMTNIERAARILYLNKTCFNGLYRVNKKGKFNVSFGDYTDPIIVDEATLRNAGNAFQYSEIFHADFESVLKNAQQGDFVYLDPPYVPVSATSDFTQYTPGSFNINDHKRLKDVFDTLVTRGCYVMLSNSNTEFVANLYSEYNKKTVTASRAINSNTAKRGAVKELLILSYNDSDIDLPVRTDNERRCQI